MALVDNLKFFNQTDGYNTVLTKADYDSNITTLANEIDKKQNATLKSTDEKAYRYTKIARVATTDSTEVEIMSVVDLPNDSIVAIDMYSQNMQDDDSTKWIFRGVIYATVGSDGTVTVNNALTDIVKDDADWSIDIGSESNIIHIGVIGKDSTNIAWSIFADIKINMV